MENNALFDVGETAKARGSDPATSHQAAASVKNITAVQSAVLSCFTRRSSGWDPRLLTDIDIAAIYNGRRVFDEEGGKDYPQASDSGLRTRRSELVRAGYLENSGLLAVLPSGRKSILWRLTDRGRKALR